MRTLILFAHPRPDRSEVNVPLIEVAKGIKGVTVVDLYDEYPSFEIDIDREQQRLLDHEAIIFQHPLYWFSAPSLLKEWQDLVLEHGWAYGREGRALAGKVALNVLTAGAERESYTPEGHNEHEIRDLLLPFEETAHHCRMRYLAPFVLFGAGRALEEGRLPTHLSDYGRFLTALVTDRLDLDAASGAATLTDNLDRLLIAGGR